MGAKARDSRGMQFDAERLHAILNAMRLHAISKRRTAGVYVAALDTELPLYHINHCTSASLFRGLHGIVSLHNRKEHNDDEGERHKSERD